MLVPYGFGVSDFIDVGKAAPESFGTISSEVVSLHAVLPECEETLFSRPLPLVKAERLEVVKEGCDRVLVDLQNLVEKYESLGTRRKNTGDRMRWGNKDIAEIRAWLTSNITILTGFISAPQISVETKLDKFIEEFHHGKKEASTVSLQSMDSLSANDRAVWRTLGKDLRKIGISVAAFDANRDSIFNWLVRAVETGASGEQDERGVNVESNGSDEQELRGNDEWGSQDRERHIEHMESESSRNISEGQSIIRPPSLESATNAEYNVPQRVPATFGQVLRTAPKERARGAQVAALLAGISRPRRRLIKAIDTQDISKALKILKDKASFHLLDLGALNKALWSASCQVGGSEPRFMNELKARGGNVNYVAISLHVPILNTSLSTNQSVSFTTHQQPSQQPSHSARPQCDPSFNLL